MAIPAGNPAPFFKMYDTERSEVTLDTFAGRILVMHFFPAAFTGVCTQQMCMSRDDLHFYHELGAMVVGISVDMPFALKAFKEKNNINFELLSDFNKETIHAYDMYQTNFTCEIRGVAKRGVVIVDPRGVVAYSEETASPGTQVNFAALKDALVVLE